MSQPSQSSFLFPLLCPILHIIASLLHLFCSFNILLHILDQIFFSAPSFPKYANFSHHLPLNTMLLSHTAPPVLLLLCTVLFLLSWIWLLISTGAILSNNSYFRQIYPNSVRKFEFTFREMGCVSHTHINPLNAELNPVCHLLALLGTHPILHISRIRVKQLPLKMVFLCFQNNDAIIYKSTLCTNSRFIYV